MAFKDPLILFVESFSLPSQLFLFVYAAIFLLESSLFRFVYLFEIELDVFFLSTFGFIIRLLHHLECSDDILRERPQNWGWFGHEKCCNIAIFCSNDYSLWKGAPFPLSNSARESYNFRRADILAAEISFSFHHLGWAVGCAGKILEPKSLILRGPERNGEMVGFQISAGCRGIGHFLQNGGISDNLAHTIGATF